jgi:hypothetical protein
LSARQPDATTASSFEMKTNSEKSNVFLKIKAHREQRRLQIVKMKLSWSETNKATENIICSWSPEFIRSSKLGLGNRTCRFSN